MPGIDVILLGGALRKGHRYLHGMLAMRSLEVLHVNLAVLCPGSFVTNRGFMTDYPQMAQLKAAFLTTGKRAILLMDASKAEGDSIMRFAGLEDVDAIIMDDDPDGIVCSAIAELPEGAHRPELVIAGALDR